MRKQLSLIFLSTIMSGATMAQSVKSHSPKLTARTVATQNARQQQTANAFIELAPETNIKQLQARYNIKFNVKTGNLHTAIVPLQMIDSIAKDPQVLRIDLGSTTRPMLDSVRVLTHIDEIHAGADGLPTSYKGKDVIVGIIDTGFDFTHPNFKDEAGHSRILCAWDQLNSNAMGNPYGYGCIYQSAEDIVNAGHDASVETHGTHVAGIAAGSAEGNYKGVAPEADIAVVSTNKTEQGIVDGVDFLMKYAEQKQKPIVINISVGVVLGFKDGSGTMARMIDTMLKDKNGILLAIATGNEGHRAATLKTNDQLKSYWEVPKYGRDNIFLIGDKAGDYSLKLTLRNQKTNEELFSQTFSTNEEWTKSFKNFGTADAANAYLAVSSTQHSLTGRKSISLNLVYYRASDEVWEIEMTANNGNMMVNCDYGSFTAGGRTDFTDGSNESSIASTATGNEPIAVGAYVSKHLYIDFQGKGYDKQWTVNALYPMSGQGPTFDGRTKPDVTAPGALVISSFNSFAHPFIVTNDIKTHSTNINSRNYYWGVASGTSMATPVVTGTLALWLQAKKDLTANEVRELLNTTSTTDIETGVVPNNQFGRGKINALAGLKKILEKTDIENLPNAMDDDQVPYVIDPINHTIIAPTAKSIQLYNATGLLLRTGHHDLNFSDLQQGIYIIRINANTTKSLKIKR